MTTLDELQRLHEAATNPGPWKCRGMVPAELLEALPALLRVARAAEKMCNDNQSSNWVLTDCAELRAAVEALR